MSTTAPASPALCAAPPSPRCPSRTHPCSTARGARRVAGCWPTAECHDSSSETRRRCQGDTPMRLGISYWFLRTGCAPRGERPRSLVRTFPEGGAEEAKPAPRPTDSHPEDLQRSRWTHGGFPRRGVRFSKSQAGGWLTFPERGRNSRVRLGQAGRTSGPTGPVRPAGRLEGVGPTFVSRRHKRPTPRSDAGDEVPGCPFRIVGVAPPAVTQGA